MFLKGLYFRVIESRVNFSTFSACSNSLPNDKILDWSKLKAFADDKIKLAEKLKFVLGRAKNTEGKGENVGYQHFLHCPQYFLKLSFS